LDIVLVAPVSSPIQGLFQRRETIGVIKDAALVIQAYAPSLFHVYFLLWGCSPLVYDPIIGSLGLLVKSFFKNFEKISIPFRAVTSFSESSS
jgi:hypothetical protein